MKTVLPLAALLLLAGCAIDTPADEKLDEAVRSSFAQHPALQADHLKIYSQDGTVYIYGFVSTYVEYTEVERVARATPGVQRVANMTTIDNTRY